MPETFDKHAHNMVGAPVSPSARNAWKRTTRDETNDGVDEEHGEVMPVTPEESGREENPEQEEDDIGETGGEAAETRSPPQVRTPIASEIEQHRRTHLPYRSWCPICVASRGKDFPHRLVDRTEDGTGIVGMDYFFLGDEDGTTYPAIAGRESISKTVIGIMVPEKGADQEWAAAELAKEIDQMGYKRLIVRCDQESSLRAVATEAKRVALTELILEDAPRGDKNANGIGERAVQTVEGQTRALKMELEGRLNITIPAQHEIIPWIVRHAADVINKEEVKASGMTPYRAIKGRPYRGIITDFGRKVLYYIHGRRGGDLRGRWSSGVWLGKDQRRDELRVDTSSEPEPFDTWLNPTRG